MKRNMVNKILLAISLMFVGSQWGFGQSVGISSNVITPDAQSILDIQTITKGILLPRMTTGQRDAISPTSSSDYGLLIYNTSTDNYNYWDGLAWQEVPITSELDADDDWYQTNSTNTPTGIGDWIWTNGNVGINTGSTIATNPLAALHVQSNMYVGDYNSTGYFNSNATLHISKNSNPHILMEDIGDNTGGISFNSGGLNVVTENGDIDFRTGVTFNGDFSSTGTARMSILNGGNVGVGTTAPDRLFTVESSTGGVILMSRNAAPISTNDVLGELQFDGFGAGAISLADASASIRVLAAETYGSGDKGAHITFLTKGINVASGTSSTERLRIAENGNVGIGETVPTAKLHVDGAAGNLLKIDLASSQRLLLASNGDLTITGKFNSSGIQESSDVRFKKNIKPLDNALENLMMLEGVSYNWRKDEFPERVFGDRTEIGVIAQEIEKIYPELVSTDADGYKSVQYSHLVPVLLEAIKEQQKLIKVVEGNVASLNATLQTSEERFTSLQKQMEIFSLELESIRVGSDFSAKK